MKIQFELISKKGLQFYQFFESPQRFPSSIMTVYRRLQFQAYCETQFGENVCICGNIPEFGNWNPLKGLKLRTQESYYPIWKSFDSIFVLQNKPIEFKIVVINSKNEFKWENILQNRIIVPQIDAYIKLTANEFETYEIFPFCQGDDEVRKGMGILSDLQSDGSSSISFKSNYKFYEYFNQKNKKSQYGEMKHPQNTSTFRDLTQFEGPHSNKKQPNQFVTFIDSLMDVEHNGSPYTGKQLGMTTHECTLKRMEQARSHSTSSDKNDFEDEKWKNQEWAVYCGNSQQSPKIQRNSARKANPQNKLTSLNRIFYSNSSESLSILRQQ